MRVMMAADRVIGGVPAVWPRVGGDDRRKCGGGRCAATARTDRVD